MNKLHIAINTKTKVTTQLEKKFDLTYYQEQTFFEKLFFKEKKYPDIYFHQGSLNTKALDMIEHSKSTIVNSNFIKEQIAEKRSYINHSKITVLYPYLNTTLIYNKKIKKEFRKKYNIKKDQKIILFTGKDLVQSGLQKFIETIVALEEKNYIVVIDTNSIQKEKVEQRLKHYKIEEKVIVLEDYPNTDQLFVVSDIFVLPTKQRLFLPNVLKAMYLKNAVFVSRDNASSEIVDSFSLIAGENDQNLGHKIDAILRNKDELKKIQKENYLVVKNMTFDNYIKELEHIININLEL